MYRCLLTPILLTWHTADPTGPAMLPGFLLRGRRPLAKRESAEVSMGSDSLTLNRGRH